ncbi:hypothetical protein DVH24_008855 [Malus domestica]|uniref:Uncharacterized protein n=1 Tax=Malus domestica TaxID=3750 RepID=A0A498JT57_MALDO|nr:hypothetical protein DVH24_008855 [Malus domestica]
MIEIPEVSEMQNPHEKVVAFLKFVRENALKSANLNSTSDPKLEREAVSLRERGRQRWQRKTK